MGSFYCCYFTFLLDPALLLIKPADLPTDPLCYLVFHCAEDPVYSFKIRFLERIFFWSLRFSKALPSTEQGTAVNTSSAKERQPGKKKLKQNTGGVGCSLYGFIFK